MLIFIRLESSLRGRRAQPASVLALLNNVYRAKMYLVIICKQLNVFLAAGYSMRLAIINILFNSTIGNYVSHKAIILKQHIYNRIKIFLLPIIVNFAANYITYGLLFAINNLLSTLHNIFVPKTIWENIALIYLSYIFLPDKAVILSTTISTSNYLSLLLFVYTTFILILDLSVLFNQMVLPGHQRGQMKPAAAINRAGTSTRGHLLPAHRWILFVNIGIIIVLGLLAGVFCFLGCLIFNKITSIFIGHLREFIVKIWGGNWPSSSSTGGPGGSSGGGGGGQPPHPPNIPFMYAPDKRKIDSDKEDFLWAAKEKMNAENLNWEITNKAHANWVDENRVNWSVYSSLRHIEEERKSHIEMINHNYYTTKWGIFGPFEYDLYMKRITKMYDKASHQIRLAENKQQRVAARYNKWLEKSQK